jgi:electron transfer flavoprotein alpha subunit
MTVYCLVELDVADVADASLRALTFARGLADGPVSPADGPVTAVVFGEPPRVNLAPYGVTDIVAVGGIDGYAPQAWARTLAALLHGPLSPGEAMAVVAAATDRGNEVLAHLGAITGAPMAANCVAVSPAVDGSRALVRQRWAGLLLEEARLDGPVILLTVATDAVSAETRDSVPVVSAETRGTVPVVSAETRGTVPVISATSAEAAAGPAASEPAPASPESALAAPVVHRVSASVSAADLVVRAVETSSGTGGASLATARVVVGGGRGVGSAAGFAPLEELAALLGGVVGVSRVVTSEGWLPHSMQVGQTGTKITPDLYLACGISGAIQHIAGCSGAKHLIAVNKDPSAPMMTRADYAVIGDLHEIIPALVRALKDRAGP